MRDHQIDIPRSICAKRDKKPIKFLLDQFAFNLSNFETRNLAKELKKKHISNFDAHGN